LPALEHHTYNKDDVEEEGGIKIKKRKIFMKMAIFLRRNKQNKNFIFIPNHHFWMSEGSLNKE
jgi:hypothetical protein